MAYTINKTDGTVLATVADGTLDTTTNLQLIGKNYAGYGEILNENSVIIIFILNIVMNNNKINYFIFILYGYSL